MGAAPREILFESEVPAGQTLSRRQGTVLVERVIVSFGEFEFSDTQGKTFRTRSGIEFADALGLVKTDPFTYELNTVMQAPLTIKAVPGGGGTFVVVYKELP